MESCREQGFPEPKIEIVPNFVNLTICFKVLLSAQDTPTYQPTDIAAVQDKVIEFCRTPRSVAEVAEMLGVMDKKWVKNKYIKPLVGVRLALTLPDRPNSRYQKYQAIEG